MRSLYVANLSVALFRREIDFVDLSVGFSDRVLAKFPGKGIPAEVKDGYEVRDVLGMTMKCATK